MLWWSTCDETNLIHATPSILYVYWHSAMQNGLFKRNIWYIYLSRIGTIFDFTYGKNGLITISKEGKNTKFECLSYGCTVHIITIRLKVIIQHNRLVAAAASAAVVAPGLLLFIFAINIINWILFSCVRFRHSPYNARKVHRRIHPPSLLSQNQFPHKWKTNDIHMHLQANWIDCACVRACYCWDWNKILFYWHLRQCEHV